MTVMLDCGIVLAAFLGGRALQWTRDARRSMGSATKRKARR
jgi:hypothetical protein